jgi:hypothetical protein
MRSQAGRMFVALGVMILVGLASRSICNAQDSQPKPAASADSKKDWDEARKAGEDMRRAGEDMRKAGEEMGKAKMKELTNGGQDFQFKFATPVVANVLFGPRPADAAIRKAAEELSDAKDDDAKAKATAELRGLLDKYFEEDMIQRQKELEGIEARLQKLHAQLERRRAKKDDIIDLQVKMSVNEADGLGFYSQPAGGTFNVMPTMPGPPTYVSKDLWSADATKEPTKTVSPSAAPTPAPAHAP